MPAASTQIAPHLQKGLNVAVTCTIIHVVYFFHSAKLNIETSLFDPLKITHIAQKVSNSVIVRVRVKLLPCA